MTWAWVFTLGMASITTVYWAFGLKKVAKMMKEKRNNND